MRFLRCFIILNFVVTTCIGQSLPDNRYGPFHRIIADSAHSTVAKTGLYISFGLGGGRVNDFTGGLSRAISISLAKKNYLFSFTLNSMSPFISGGGQNESHFSASYFGLLIGECFRMENVLFSLSTGVASAAVAIDTPGLNNSRNEYSYNGVSIPVEIKIFALAHNGVGLGVHFSKNFLIDGKYSPFSTTLSLVFGRWNNPRG